MIDRFIKLLTGDLSPEEKRMLVRMSFRVLLVFHIAWACGWLSIIGLSGFAQAGTIDEVEKKVVALETTMMRTQRIQQRSTLEAEIRRLDQEIFTIQAKMQEETRNGVPPATIYSQRLAELSSDKTRIQTRLEAFMRANPDIAGILE